MHAPLMPTIIENESDLISHASKKNKEAAQVEKKIDIS